MTTEIAPSILTYLADLEALISELKLKRFIAFGTSLGGLMTMLLAAAGPGRIAGALLNDTWEWDGAAWVEKTPATSPPACP